jgi:hypothetical protein
MRYANRTTTFSAVTVALGMTGLTSFINSQNIASYAKIGNSCLDIEDVSCGTNGTIKCQIVIKNETYTPYSDASCVILVTSNVNRPIESSLE